MDVLNFQTRIRKALDIDEQYVDTYESLDQVLNYLHIELIRGGAFDTRAEPSDREETAQKGQEAAREMIREQQDKIEELEAQPVTPQIVAEMTDTYEEIRRLVQIYKVEPGALIGYTAFLWKQHLYDTGIEVGHWLENFYKLENSVDDKPDVARICNNLGLLLSDANRLKEAERYYRDALEIWRRLAKANPAAFEPDLAMTCNNLGILLSDTNRTEEAERYYRDALEIWRPPMSIWAICCIKRTG